MDKMGIKIGTTIKNLQDYSVQNSMRDNTVIAQSSDVNARLAIYFYNFLVGKSNKLPSHEYVDKVMDAELRKNQAVNSERPVLISMACGMTVFCDASDEKHLIVEEETPITPTRSRFDKITHNGYNAYRIRPNLDVNMYYEEINPEKEPLFVPRRVELLQNYLKEYSLRSTAINEMFLESYSNEKPKEK